MLSDLASSAKYPEVKAQQKIENDGELQTEVDCHKPATRPRGKKALQEYSPYTTYVSDNYNQTNM